MDVVTTSLEALMQRVTNAQNQKPDIAATEAFCVMLTKESDGIQIGTKLLASRIQSPDESEALQALALLDTCMRRCGPPFHAEIGKFRFLNEMIRLVSPKYLGGRTPVAVRQKVLWLLHTWTKEYPRETKVKEAYEMLKKQGVVEEPSGTAMNFTEDAGSKILRNKHTIFDDEEKSKLLQKLLRSKNPDDLQAANRLIKTMVREDERRVQLNSRRVMELESVHNNAKLLSEMLDSYNRDETSAEDLELMKELHQACERLKPIVLRLANETQDNEEMLGDVLSASDELGRVFEKYITVIVLGGSIEPSKTSSAVGPSLLDLSLPTENVLFESGTGSSTTCDATGAKHKSDMEVLGDIFGSLGKCNTETSTDSTANLLIPDSLASATSLTSAASTIMQPISILPNSSKRAEMVAKTEKKLDSKARALEELNELGESLLKQSLSGTMSNSRFNSEKQSMISASKAESLIERYDSTISRDDFSFGCNVLGSPAPESSSSNGPVNSVSRKSDKTNNNNNTNNNSNNNDDNKDDDDDNADDDDDDDDNDEDTAVHNETHNSINSIAIRRGNAKYNEQSAVSCNMTSSIALKSVTVNMEPEIKPLTDISVNLGDIRPGNVPPMTVIEEKNGISVVLHFAQDNPRPDVFVVVITTMSKNSKPLSNYLFQAVVPKTCKCRLQPPSGTELPGHNPFLPPSAITQIMLVANPNEESVSLKFMLSYTMDGETFTEMGEVEKLPRP